MQMIFSSFSSSFSFLWWYLFRLLLWILSCWKCLLLCPGLRLLCIYFCSFLDFWWRLCPFATHSSIVFYLFPFLMIFIYFLHFLFISSGMQNRISIHSVYILIFFGLFYECWRIPFPGVENYFMFTFQKRKDDISRKQLHFLKPGKILTAKELKTADNDAVMCHTSNGSNHHNKICIGLITPFWWNREASSRLLLDDFNHSFDSFNERLDQISLNFCLLLTAKITQFGFFPP